MIQIYCMKTVFSGLLCTSTPPVAMDQETIQKKLQGFKSERLPVCIYVLYAISVHVSFFLLSFLTNEELPTLIKFQCDYELAIGTGDCAYGTCAIRKLTTMVILPITPNSYPRNCTMTMLPYHHTVSSKIYERCYISTHIL